jgi:hemerythrin-like domain-containing protein
MTERGLPPSFEGNDWDPSTRPDDRPMGDALAQHHRGIEAAFEAIATRAKNNDASPALRRAWDTFERELLKHMEIEEQDLLPLFGRLQGEEARALRAEHDVIRERLFELGLALDLHQLRSPAIEEFAARLRTHALREDLVLYPWAERQLSQDSWHALGLGLSDGDALAKIAFSRS